MKRKLSPPEEKNFRDMYRRCTIYLDYYYSERECKGAGTCPCMEINVSVHYNGGLLPDIMLSTRCNYIKYLGTVKASTRMILVHVVQKM